MSLADALSDEKKKPLIVKDCCELIDSEVKRIMTAAHDEARRILTGMRDRLEAVTRRLLEIEVMEGDELRRILGATAGSSPAAEPTTPLPPVEGVH